MTEPKFTHAPWLLDGLDGRYAIIFSNSNSEIALVEVGHYDEETETEQKANANLISSAPDLYDFIARLVNSGSSLDILKIVEEGELLLAKARGE